MNLFSYCKNEILQGRFYDPTPSASLVDLKIESINSKV